MPTIPVQCVVVTDHKNEIPYKLEGFTSCVYVDFLFRRSNRKLLCMETRGCICNEKEYAVHAMPMEMGVQ